MNAPHAVDVSTPDKLELYKKRSTHSRFMHQMFLGLGGATVFGLVGVLSKSLLEFALAGQVAAVAGLVGIGIVGIGCLYLGAKYLSNTIMLDNDYQAKKIGEVAVGKGKSQGQGQAPIIVMQEPALETNKQVHVPLDVVQASEKAETFNVPGTSISSADYQQRIMVPQGEKITLH